MKQRVLLPAIMVAAMLACGCKEPREKLLGTWKTVSGGESIYFTFQENSNLNVNNEVFMKYFVTEDKRLILGVQDPVPFSIKGNTLRIQQETNTLIYTRVK